MTTTFTNSVTNAFERWRRRNRLTVKRLACLLKTTPPVVSRYLHGGRIPSRDMMARIWLLTRGEVTPTSFYVLPPLPPLPRAAAREAVAVAS